MEGFLIATHVSSLNLTAPTVIPIQTTRHHLPLPQLTFDSNVPAEHAIFTSVIDTPITGTLLLRLIHDGLIIELVSLSTTVPPIRLVFPSIVLESPAVFLWDTTELHILAVTEAASLHRVVIPIQGRTLWQNEVDSVWPREYLITSFPENSKDCLVHAQGSHCVAISMPNGSLLRLDATSLGYDGHDEEWTESLHHHASFLTSLTSFLPTMHSGQPSGADIISMATHPWPSDIGHVWTLSRDRTLRLWKARLGCVASKTLPYSTGALEMFRHANSPSGGSGRQHPLLDSARQTLLRVFSAHSPSGDHIYVLAFIPLISSVTSGGFFCLIDTSNDQFREVGVIEGSKRTARSHLQDYMILGNSLFALWESRGRSTIESTVLDIEALENHDVQPAIWKPSAYGQEPELTPAYMEEQLLSTGSLAEKFLAAIMKPGAFSSLTLRTAIDQYTDACLSLPGPPPPQLMSTYTTLCENIATVVGCTVTLNRDPQSGSLQYANYWTALKRDWEGFVARCREVERSARWPLVLGARGPNDVILVERERAGSLVIEDMTIYLHRLLRHNQLTDASYTVLAISGALREKLGPEVMANLEDRVRDIMHQEFAFSFVDILQDQGNKLRIKENLDEGSASWFYGRLQSIDSLDKAIRLAIDTIGGLDYVVKREDEEGELTTLLPPHQSEWARGLAARYIADAVEARYDLSLSIITLLLFLSDELGKWEASLLFEVFAVFKGASMLRYVSAQPTERPIPAETGSTPSPDDVIARLRNMDVSHNKNPSTSHTSLVHILLSQTGSAGCVPTTAHSFLDSTGLFQSVSPANATKYEILFCERLRLLGFHDTARELLSCLPRTPAATYILAQIWLDIGRFDDAAQIFERLAGSFGLDAFLNTEDAEALSLILPATQSIASDFHYYIYVSSLFKAGAFVRYEVHFAQLAISVAPPGSETAHLWLDIVKGFTELSLYEEAYAAIISMPYEKEKRDCASQLALRMCEENSVARLMAFDFTGVSEEVESSLSFKARNADPRLQPNYPRILYTWYIQRGDYRNACLAMYQRARKLQESIVSSALFVSLAEEQLDAYSIAINALSLVDENFQWVILPAIPDPSRRRKTLSKHVPESQFLSSKYEAEIVDLADMQKDHILLSAQIDIIKRDPQILTSAEFLLPPSLIVMRLGHENLYNQAMTIARSLKVDMTDLFTHLTSQCLRLSRNSQGLMQENDSDWFLTDDASTWSGTPADRGWRFLRQALKRHDSAEIDHRYTKASLETILILDRASPPAWLVQILELHHPEYLIRLCLRYGITDDAVSYTLSLLRKSDARLSRETSPQNSASTWVPYSLIDQVLVTAKPSPLLSQLHSEVASRLKRIQKLSNSSG